MKSSPTNPSLVQRAVRGDQAALSSLLTTYQQRLYNVVLRMVDNRDDAAEVTQQAMLKIVEHICGFDGRSDISTWMVRIAMNLSFTHLRKQRVRWAASLDSSSRGAGDSSKHGLGDDQLTPLRQKLADTREPSPAQRVQQEEMLEYLRVAMGNLQDDLRAVLVLRDIDGMDYQKISLVMAIPVGTVKSRLFRARLALRQEMAKLDAVASPHSPQAATPKQPPARRRAKPHPEKVDR